MEELVAPCCEFIKRCHCDLKSRCCCFDCFEVGINVFQRSCSRVHEEKKIYKNIFYYILRYQLSQFSAQH